MQPYHLPTRTLFFVNKKAAHEIIDDPDGMHSGAPYWLAQAYGILRWPGQSVSSSFWGKRFYAVSHLASDGQPCYSDDGESFIIDDGALDVRADTVRARLLSWCAQKLGASSGPWCQAYGLHCSAWETGKWKLQSTDGIVYPLPWLKAPGPKSGQAADFIEAVAAATVELVFKIAIMEELGLPVELYCPAE